MSSIRKQLLIRLDEEYEKVLEEIFSYYIDPKPTITQIIKQALNAGLFLMRNQLRDGKYKGPKINPEINSIKGQDDSI